MTDMDGYCTLADDKGDIGERVTGFLTDRTTDAVTGIRRMGRTGLVGYALDLASGKGLKVTLHPDVGDGTGTVLFDHWDGMQATFDELRERYPDIDIVFGQDLCHQVPALVRLR